MKFSPGDKAIVINGLNEACRAHIGQVVTLVEYKDNMYFDMRYVGCMWTVDISHVTYFQLGFLSGHKVDVAYRESDLRPYYDGMEKSSWKNSVWKPKEIAYVDSRSSSIKEYFEKDLSKALSPHIRIQA